MKKITIYKAYKMNVIELAKHHKKNCESSECGVNLFLLREMCEKLGIEFTDKEKEIFT